MKKYRNIIIPGVCVLCMITSLDLWAQDDGKATKAKEQKALPSSSTAPLPSSPVPSVKPMADGVFPSIAYQGDIVDFLKIISVSTNKNIVPSRKVKGAISVNLFNVTAKETLDAVLSTNGFAYEEVGPFIYVYTQKEMAEKIAALRKTESQVFKINYVSAKDAQDLIQHLLSPEGKITTTPESGGLDSAENWAGDSCLVIIDYPENLEIIAETLKSIDKRPVQVLVEATILSASLDDNNELGIDFNVLAGVDFETLDGVITPPMGSSTALSGTKVEAGLEKGSLNFGIVKGNVGLFVNALESITDVTSLGNPKILTLNRQMGEVRVGRDEGYIGSTESTSTASTQTVQMLETGTILKFTPFVMEDGYIRMEIHPEDSTGKVTLKGEFALPEKTTTEVTTNILLKDGHTIVIGGLFRENVTLGRSQVPGIGNIPLLGHLFRNTIDNNVKEEVIFLITPHIVREEVDYAMGEETLENCNRLLLGARENIIGLARERIANAHYNRAREHQAAGRLDKALWHIELATYIKPIFLDALQLRDELRGRKIYVGEIGSMQSFMRRLIAADSDNISAVNLVENLADTVSEGTAETPQDDKVQLASESAVVAESSGDIENPEAATTDVEQN